MENITRENEQITTPEQAAAELGIKLETLQKQYAMEKTLWYERTKIREEEAASIRAQLAEREQYARGELKQKEDAANALQRKIAELEAKLMLEQELSKAKIERKESDIKELQAKYDSQKEKYLQDINLVESKYSFKEEEARRLSGLIAQREVELGSQVQWKQQEALLQKSRFEEEIKKLSLELDAEKERRSKMSLEYNTGLSSMREQLSREVMELKIRHEEENRQHEKLSLRAREIETERMNFLSTINMLNMRVEEL
ncbi:MAG TPA: hypothetical protein VJC03_02335, partial [bacterium]|nr:hypothetical protein [bacterium]